MKGPKAVDNEQWELLGGQPLFGGTHRLQSHAENGAIFHAPLYSPTYYSALYYVAHTTLHHYMQASTGRFNICFYCPPICSEETLGDENNGRQQAEFAILEISNQNSTQSPLL
jgi:hypothetical protein